MSMDEMLLQELYGSEEVQAEEQIKQAQVELVEAVAAEAGVDLNELDDEELEKFAHYVLSSEDEVQEDVETIDTEIQEEKLAEADLMGRQMARSYMDELNSLNGEDSMNEPMDKVAHAMTQVAEAWELEKQAAHEAITQETQENEQEKLASALVENGFEALALAELYTPEEFAKEAEYRAAEILAANGVHPETFEDIEPQEVKIASFPGTEDASSEDEAQYLAHYNDSLDRAALHIIQSLFDEE